MSSFVVVALCIFVFGCDALSDIPILLGGAAESLAYAPEMHHQKEKHYVQWYRVIKTSPTNSTGYREEKVRPSLNRKIEQIFRGFPEFEAGTIDLHLEGHHYSVDIDKINTDGGQVWLRGWKRMNNFDDWWLLRRGKALRKKSFKISAADFVSINSVSSNITND